MTVLADHLPYFAAAWLAVIGLYGMASSRNLIHMVMCMCVFQSSVWLLLITVGFRREATAPVFDDVSPLMEGIDPVMQAITITDIVVGAAIIAILLAFSVHIYKRFGTLDPDELNAIKK